MTPVSYLMSVTTNLEIDVHTTVAILNIAGRGQALGGIGDDVSSTNLSIIPKGRASREEVITQLLAIPEIQNVSIVVLSNPVKEKELAEVRELFAGIGWDASGVTDDALSLFINDKLLYQFNYYIHYEQRKKGMERIQIRRLEEHPDFSPEWLKAIANVPKDVPNRIFTVEDIRTERIEITDIQEDADPFDISPPTSSPEQ